MKDRDRAIQEIRDRLQRRASPRLHMLALVAATAATGFFSSFVLLKSGVTMMAIRYPVAVLIAYLAFLALISIWLRRFRLRARENPAPSGSVHFDLDVLEIPIDSMWDVVPRPNDGVSNFGGGGGFGGGGASGTWTGPTSARVVAAPPIGGGGGGGFDVDLDDAAWLIPVAIIAAIALSVVVYIVYIAPALFAELLLDVGLATGLYRRLTNIERRSWLTTAVRNTVVPAGFIAGLLALAGGIMQAVYPDAVSVGVVAQHVVAQSHQHRNESVRSTFP